MSGTYPSRMGRGMSGHKRIECQFSVFGTSGACFAYGQQNKPLTMEWTPDLRQLRALVAVAEEGSFTLAARKLFLTQSAVSHSIRALEDQIGTRLLDRHGKHVSVTPEGYILLRRTSRVIQELEEATREIDGLRRWGQTTIRVGAPHSLCHFMIPSVLREFRDCFPRCEPSVESGETADLLEKLQQGELDLVVGIKPKNHDAEGYRSLLTDQLCFVVSPFHPWATGGGDITGTLAAQQFIIYAKATDTHRMIEEWMEKMAGKIRSPLVIGDMQAIKQMVKLGTAVGIVASWVAAREVADGTLVAVDIPGQPLHREWGVFHAGQRQPSLVEESFIGLCSMAFDNMAQ
jgi:DNA-binding transcriptional LysR family regulator